MKAPKPKEKPQPGSLAFLAQRDASTPGLRPDGPICGQCEIKAAAVVKQMLLYHCFDSFLECHLLAS